MISDEHKEPRAKESARISEAGRISSVGHNVPDVKSAAQNFAKSEHLIKTKDFDRVYKEGRTFKGGFIILKVLQNQGQVNRIGFSISARSVKLASRRNRIKRLFREAYRKHKGHIKIGYDMVLVVRRDTKVGFGYLDAVQTLLGLYKQAGVLK